MAHRVWRTRPTRRSWTASSAPARSAAMAASSRCCVVRCVASPQLNNTVALAQCSWVKAIAHNQLHRRCKRLPQLFQTLTRYRHARPPVLRGVHLPLARKQLALPGVPRHGQPPAASRRRSAGPGALGRRRRRPPARTDGAAAGPQQRHRAACAQLAAGGAPSAPPCLTIQAPLQLTGWILALRDPRHHMQARAMLLYSSTAPNAVEHL